MGEQPAPTLKKLDVTIGRLRLLLADISSRETAQRGQRQTFLDQRDALVTFGLYGDSSLDSVLAMLSDVEERVAHAEGLLRSLERIRRRAATELESLELTKKVEEARTLVHQLQARQVADPDSGSPLPREAVEAEIARLQLLIEEASERAARSIEQSGRRAS